MEQITKSMGIAERMGIIINNLEQLREDYPDDDLITMLSIPRSIYVRHIKGEENNPEYTKYMLDVYSEMYVTQMISSFEGRCDMSDLDIKEEWKKIEDFIEIYEEKRSNRQLTNADRDEIIYKRLTNKKGDYYGKTPIKNISPTSREVVINANYILFKKYLEELKDIKVDSSQIEASLSKKQEFTMKQIALMHFYEGKPISYSDAENIAESYGFKRTKALYNKYTHFADKSNRQGYPGTEKKYKNLKKLLESIENHISKGHETLKKDLEILCINKIPN